MLKLKQCASMMILTGYLPSLDKLELLLENYCTDVSAISFGPAMGLTLSPDLNMFTNPGCL